MRMPGTCGRLALRETLRFGFLGWITERASVSAIRSIRQLCDAWQDKTLDVAARRHVAQGRQRVDQGVQLGPRYLAGAIEKLVLAEEVIGLLDILGLLAAGRHQDANDVGAVAIVVEVRRALAVRSEHAFEHVL